MVGEGVAGIAAFQNLHERVRAVLVFLDLVLHVGEGGAAGNLAQVVEFVQEFAHVVTVLCIGDKIIKKNEKLLLYLSERTKNVAGLVKKVWLFYRDGFKNQTWGRPLIWLVILKFFILFAILRVFFFRPVLAGKTDAEKSETVGENLTRNHNNTQTNNLNEQPWIPSSGPVSSLP
ncbi:MAG: DUF4492 domain-containing protein [Bacteroidales bacterium]|nr:DUF4492 domain-containing protein [Bacteroidales bacterium]